MPYQPVLRGLDLPLPPPLLPDADDLSRWPDVTPDAVCRQAKRLGAAGEALFDSQALCFGEVVAKVPDFLPYDRVILRRDQTLRVQIKASVIPGRGGYEIALRRGYRGSPQGMRPYEADDFDLLAIVLLRDGVIFYSSSKRERQLVSFAQIPYLRAHPRESYDAALAEIEAARQDQHPRWAPG